MSGVNIHLSTNCIKFEIELLNIGIIGIFYFVAIKFVQHL